MDFKDFLLEKSGGVRKVIVVYGGGFQPFHQGHMSSYEQSKKAFPKGDFYVATSSDVKVRPIPFEDKKFLAQQAGVTDHIVQAKSPLNPTEITDKYDPEKDILILVRSERDPVPYTKKDGSPAYYQPFVSVSKCKPFGDHGYIYVTKKKVFKIGKDEVFSGSQIRKMYAEADDKKKEQIITSLYPRALKPKKIKTLLDKYLGGVKEDLDFEFSELLSEGVHDKGIFKAVFLSGGPGSGKDYVLDNTLSGHGLTEINSDKALEFLMDKEGLDKKMPDSEKEVRDFVRGRAKNVTELKQKLALLGRNGLIINGTGDDIEKIKKIKKELEGLGYETSMIAVNTADEISKQRNVERGQRGGRTVPEDIRRQKWDAVQKARPEMAKLFGQNYTEFDNSEDLRTAAPEVVKAKKEEMMNIFKKVKEFTSRPVKNEKAQQWISNEIHSKDTLGVKSKGVDLSAHPESGAYQDAMKLGLQYFGFGRYGKDNKITHHSIHDKLVPINKIKPPEVKIPTVGTSTEKKKVNEQINQLFEQVTIHITADTAEEAAQAFHLIKSDSVHENIQLSDDGAKNLLNLGSNRTPEFIRQLSFNRWQDMVKETVHKNQEKFLKDGEGKTRVFMLRKSAAEEAHQTGGEVVKQGKGYAVKLKENENVRLDQESLHSKITMGKGRLSEESTCCTSCDTIDKNGGNHGNKKETSTKGTKSTKGSSYTKEAKEEVIESIDKGIEPGLSMASSGENMTRGTTRVKQIKKPLEELTGDETTMSIGDQKENELRRKGIYLSTFKAKKFV